MHERGLVHVVQSTSYLEYAFLRWVATPATLPGIEDHLEAQAEIEIADRRYLVDYLFRGSQLDVAVELDGFTFHSSRSAFTYDRFRQNDLSAAGLVVVRFSYDAVRLETERCVAQLTAIFAQDMLLAAFINPSPTIDPPDMQPDPIYAITASPMKLPASAVYFDEVRPRINRRTLRRCQAEAFEALANYYGYGGLRAACVMSVGAGKTALGVAAALAFTRRRALIVTPGNVIRGTFAIALDHTNPRNVLYGLPNGPLIPGAKPPATQILDRDEGPVREVTRNGLLSADLIVTNFHSLGTGDDPDHLLSKLLPDDIDFIVVDEAHIAAAESYQRLFAHFPSARTLLMSACFQRLDGKPIDADVVYRYRLIDSIADGNAKNLRVHRFAPSADQTVYEMVWPDGGREEVIGRAAILELLGDERKLASITARSDEPIRRLMREVRRLLDEQETLLFPVKPRALFAALGERHAEQLARIANEYLIPTDYLHHTMSEGRIRRVRDRFESGSGDLQAIVQLKMLGQGYDFPPISVVVPMRPYGSFSEFYQFIGRGIRVLTHPALAGRVQPSDQYLDIVYHADLGLDEHLHTLYLENDMDPTTVRDIPDSWTPTSGKFERPGSAGRETAEHPEAFVVFQQGQIEARIVHDVERVELRKAEREQQALAQRYAAYVQGTHDPVTFEQFVEITRRLKEGA